MNNRLSRVIMANVLCLRSCKCKEYFSGKQINPHFFENKYQPDIKRQPVSRRDALRTVVFPENDRKSRKLPVLMPSGDVCTLKLSITFLAKAQPETIRFTVNDFRIASSFVPRSSDDERSYSYRHGEVRSHPMCPHGLLHCVR
jgi:hypothetical protein